MSEKIYLVKSETQTRLVQAVNKSAALRYVAETDYVVSSASQVDLIAALKSGIEVELSKPQ
jgi:hypothetical protein